jgi:16S rRNA (uracil1498-N3)-methyltransferase
VSVPRLHVPELAGALASGGDVAVPEAAAHHAARVLRLRAGDRVALFTGEGGEFDAQIARVDRREVIASVNAFRAIECESPLHVTLVQAIAAADAMDYAIRKSVELGVAAIQPVVTARSAPLPDGERARGRAARWQQIAVAACEQCGRNRVPTVHAPVSLPAWLIARDTAATALMLAPGASRTLGELAAPAGLEVLVGPEGGFDDAESAACRDAGLTAVRLGPRVLRTETAGPALLASANVLWGDFR